MKTAIPFKKTALIMWYILKNSWDFQAVPYFPHAVIASLFTIYYGF